jgi:hypothetical protein
MTILVIIAAAITAPSSGFENARVTPIPITRATLAPLSRATRTSRQTARQRFDWVSWLVASARQVTASVWVPALPPTPATIGINMASATIWAMAASKKLMMVDATSAVPRLAISHLTRAL